MVKALCAVLSGASVAVGTGLVYLPAGLVVGGLEGIAGVYVWAYLETVRAAK